MSIMWHVFFVFATSTVVTAKEAITVECKETSVIVTWKVNKELAKKPSRLLLGDCFPSKFDAKANGEGEAVFHYNFSGCRFRQMKTQTKVIYESDLTFRPLPNPNSATFIYPIKCVFERPKGRHQFVKPALAVWQSRGGLIYHMGVLNDDLSGPALSSAFPLGSLITIWAAVEQQAHQSLNLYLEECLASSTPTLGPESRTYPIITNQGCLVDGKRGYSRFLPRSQPSSILLQLQAFKFAAEQEVYIHCKLVVWDPDDLNEEKKACNFNKLTGEWELLDDPLRNDLCRCCEYGCQRQVTRAVQLAQRSLVGHLMTSVPLTSNNRSIS